jgi:hypothetical protein
MGTILYCFQNILASLEIGLKSCFTFMEHFKGSLNQDLLLTFFLILLADFEVGYSLLAS